MSYIDELLAEATAAHQAATLADFGSKPLIVVTAGQGHDGRWLAAQDKLAALSTNSRYRVVVDATHASLVLDQTDAVAASRGISDVLRQCGRRGRSSRPGQRAS